MRSRLSAPPLHLITRTLTYGYNEIHCFIACLNYIPKISFCRPFFEEVRLLNCCM